MVLPIALITVAAVLIIKGFTNASLTDIINGNIHSGGSSDPNVNTSTEPLTTGGTTDTSGRGVTSGNNGLGIVPTAVANVSPKSIDGHLVAGWIGAIVLWARDNGWTGSVTSGIRSDQEQAQACIHVCGNPQGCPNRCAAPGTSNHKGIVFPLGAVDVTNPSQFAQVLSRYPGGAPLKNALPDTDPVHFSRTGH